MLGAQFPMMQLHFAGPMAKPVHMANQGVDGFGCFLATNQGTVSLTGGLKVTISRATAATLRSRYRTAQCDCPVLLAASRNISRTSRNIYTKRQLHGWSEQQAGASSYQSGDGQRPYQDDGQCAGLCGKTTFFHPHQRFVRPYTTPDNAPTYHAHGPRHLGSCISRLVISTLALCQVPCGAVRAPIQIPLDTGQRESWLGKFGVMANRGS